MRRIGVYIGFIGWSGIYGFYIDLCGCQKISLERCVIYIGYGLSVCQYIVGMNRFETLHT